MIVLFVVDNYVSKMAYQVAKTFLKHELDQLHIVTSISGHQTVEKAQDLLETFQDVAVKSKITAKVLARGDSKVNPVGLNEIDLCLKKGL